MPCFLEHYKAIITFALNTGLRLGELQHQRWEDVDLASGVLTVSRPKSGKREQLPLNTTAFTILTAADQSGELVFPRMPKHMSKTFRRYADKEVIDASFHDLRDTYISRLAPSVNPIILMTLARHRDFKTTQRYLKLDRLRSMPGRRTARFGQKWRAGWAPKPAPTV